MIVNVHAIAAIHSERSYNPIEVVTLLNAAKTGTEISTDVPNTTLVSDFILAVTTQLAITALPIHEPFYLVKGDIVLDSTKTLEQNGLVVNDLLHLRVTLLLI